MFEAGRARSTELWLHMWHVALQANLREKAKRLHAMRGELGLRHAQVDDYKLSIKRMQVPPTSGGCPAYKSAGAEPLVCSFCLAPTC